MPLFSVIIPTYNRAAKLRQAIESVLVQDVEDYELLIVDDGSTDETATVVRAYTEDPRVRYHYQTNRQLNGARNTGVRLAEGRYCCFLDDDDYFLDSHLGVLLDGIETGTETPTIYRSGQLLEQAAKRKKLPLFPPNGDPLTEYWRMPVAPIGMAIPTATLRAAPFDEDLILLDDFAWFTDVLRYTALHQINDHTAVSRAHDQQRSATYLTTELLQKNLAVIQACYQRSGVAERVPRHLLHKQLIHQYTHFARQLNRNGQKRAALRVLGESLSPAGIRESMDWARTLGAILLR